MTQYMFSVHHEVGEEMPTGDDVQRMFTQVDAFNQKVTDAGLGVRRRPRADRDDHDGRRHRAEPIITDGPYAEAKEWLGGFWILEAPDLDAALGWPSRRRRPARARSSPALPARRDDRPSRSSGSSARSTAGSSPP